MQRWLWVVLITSLVSVSATSVRAQDKSLGKPAPAGPQLGGRLSRFREERPAEIPSASYLIYQRAQRHAEQRAARIEANKWAGYAPTRPSIGNAVYAVDQNPGIYHPWVAAYNGYHFGW